MAEKFWNSHMSDKGEFERKDSVFRNWITADGSSGFPAEAGRYHLYVSLACPWANRTLIVRNLKGLQDVISVTVVDWMLTEKGWNFTDDKPHCTPDTVNGKQYLRQVYQIADPDYNSNVTVPTLWDKKKKTLVNNESSEIIRMLNTEFNEFCKTEEQKKLDLYPKPLRAQIDELNSWIYPQINNGVYRAGAAQKQEAYDKAVREVFDGLDKVEKILSTHRYLTGSQLTEADIRLFVTLIRFDPVYVQHFKCNKKMIIDYPNIWGFTRELYQMSEIKTTIDFEHITKHYMVSHKPINPSGIIAIGPEINYDKPHGRDSL